METIIKQHVQRVSLSWGNIVKLIIFAVILGNIVASIVMWIGKPFFGWYNVGLISFFAVLICLFVYSPSREYLRNAWNIRELKNWRNYFWVIGGFFINWIAYSSLHHIPSQSIWEVFTSSHHSYPLDTTILQKAQYILSNALMAPICEEVVVRGIIFKRIMEDKGMFTGVVVSSLIFAIMHHSLDMLYFMQLFVSGVSLALTYRYTRSLIFPILLHGIWNILCL
ncbi:hypothetical protein SAMN04488168_10364 [Bacillus sp. 491mf]|uniref:CPBP family intramembrane glutamic endopeptidase n=1 Tax=Bacillus sp. 491mf TaxID=1761755 RepID=UPI0008EA9D64|nr:type II CAAX endopeptidase family protein [Bacillus sp. 491mf]SFC26553.1 hypothetical protein SAMN04488168_10364 [Bacillus sp. 491mf]